MFSNSGCGCNRCNSCNCCNSCNRCNSCNSCGWNSSMNGCRATPIVAPRRVCTSCSNQYVEQPIICPIECRHVNNVVYYPRYYPRYERTFMTQCAGNPFVNAANATPYNNSGFNTTGDSVFNGMYNTGSNVGNSCGCNR